MLRLWFGIWLFSCHTHKGAGGSGGGKEEGDVNFGNECMMCMKYMKLSRDAPFFPRKVFYGLLIAV